MENERKTLQQMGIGIKDVKEVLKTGIQIYEGIDKSLEDDDQISLWEYTNFIPAIMSMRDAINGVSEVPKQLADIDEAEAEELKAFMIDELDLNNDVIEATIEQLFALIMDMFADAMKGVELIRSL